LSAAEVKYGPTSEEEIAVRNGARSLRALVIQHEESAPGGHVHPWLEERGADQDVVRIDVEDRVPSPHGFDLIISLGSECAASDDTIPWLERERQLLRDAAVAEIPLLGICFGGQLLARALGGDVLHNERPEIGWLPVSTRDASLVTDGPWFQWHFDTFTPPPGARLIADRERSAQAYTLGRSMGLQFHPEVTPEMIAAWAADSGDELDQGGVDPDRLLEQTHRLADQSRAAAWRLFDAFLHQIAAIPQSGRAP
jgi:GMP synthase (glutamine-hydrolysing)